MYQSNVTILTCYHYHYYHHLNAPKRALTRDSGERFTTSLIAIDKPTERIKFVSTVNKRHRYQLPLFLPRRPPNIEGTINPTE